jgi:hypothetical protein
VERWLHSLIKTALTMAAVAATAPASALERDYLLARPE